MEALPTYLLWSAFGVVTLISVFLGGLMIGLALVGRYGGKSVTSRTPKSVATADLL